MITKFDTSSAPAPQGGGSGGGSGTAIVVLLVLAVAGYLAYKHFTKQEPEKENQPGE
jgi:hypothetical protein